MNKENKCALCSNRSIHNGSCLVDNKGCKFKPNGYVKIFAEELETIKVEMQKRCDEFRWDNDDIVSEALIKIVDKHISEMKGE